MKIVDLPIKKIRPAIYNPRKDLKPGDEAYELLKKSLETFNAVEPLVWNERTGNLVSGHQRLKILKDRGDTKVTVSVVNLSERDEKVLNLALNKHGGEWDFGTLADVLQELDTGDFDLEIAGFTEKDLEEMMTWTPEDEESEQTSGISLMLRFANETDRMECAQLLGLTEVNPRQAWWPPEGSRK